MKKIFGRKLGKFGELDGNIMRTHWEPRKSGKKTFGKMKKMAFTKLTKE